MTYELAKKLKDAGFPQPQTVKFEGFNKLPNLGTEPVHYPNLSELIEACDSLVEDCVYISGHKDSWTAVDGRDGFGIYGGNGATPEEAAGELWIELKTNAV